MNDFINKLVSLGKGTMANMSSDAVKKRKQEMAESTQARDEGMIRENFGNRENYENIIGKPGEAEYEKLFTPVYVKILRSLLGK